MNEDEPEISEQMLWLYPGVLLTLDVLDPFLRGYLQTALFTTDPDMPGGCDYVDCGRACELFDRIPLEFIKQAEADCIEFQRLNREDLDEALDMKRIDGYDEESAGSDFWYTRGGHGVGYWDRDLGDLGDKLSEAAEKFGEHYLELGGWWLQYYTCKCGETWTRPEDADNDPQFGYDKCEACGAEVESDNRKYGENMTAIEEPEDEAAPTSVQGLPLAP